MVSALLKCLPGRYFIAGTDTGVGKTLFSAAFLHLAAQAGLGAQGVKPVAAGCEYNSAQARWENEDARVLQHYASISCAYTQVNPVALPRACSPHMAAASAGIRLDANALVGQVIEVLSPEADLVIVEGAGGWYAPISASETMAAVAQKLNFPVILVVGLRLGCLNHAVLTERAIVSDGVPIAGWVASHCEKSFTDAQENIAWLSQALSCPLVGEMGFCSASESCAFQGYPVVSAAERLIS